MTAEHPRPRRSPVWIGVLGLSSALLAVGSFALFALGMCISDGMCSTDESRSGLAYAGSAASATLSAAALAQAVSRRVVPTLVAAAVALAIAGYAITQVDA